MGTKKSELLVGDLSSRALPAIHDGTGGRAWEPAALGRYPEITPLVQGSRCGLGFAGGPRRDGHPHRHDNAIKWV